MNNKEEISFYLESPLTEEPALTGSNPVDAFSNISVLHESANGMARILNAYRYGKRFVLKTFQPATKVNSLNRTILRKEFEIGIALDHVNIRKTLGYEHVKGIGNCIILEYIDGVPLNEALERGLINLRNIRSICKQLASAVEYIHSKQIIHRDLKPANIMITWTGGVVKLIDFSLSDSEMFTVVKNPGGTRSYMAPEQASPDVHPSVEADIFSLGKIIGELAIHIKDTELTGIASKCCQFNPADRPHSISETGLLEISLEPHEQLFNLNSRKLTYLLLAISALFIFIIFITFVI